MGNELATFSFHSRTFETRRVYLFPKALLFTGSHASNDGTPASHERIKPFSWMVTGWFDEVLYFLKKRSEDLKNSFRHTCEVKTLNSIQVSWTSNVFYSKGGWDQRSFMADLLSKMKKIITFPCEFLAALGPGSWRTVFVFWWPRLRYPTCPTLLKRSIDHPAALSYVVIDCYWNCTLRHACTIKRKKRLSSMTMFLPNLLSPLC